MTLFARNVVKKNYFFSPQFASRACIWRRQTDLLVILLPCSLTLRRFACVRHDRSDTRVSAKTVGAPNFNMADLDSILDSLGKLKVAELEQGWLDCFSLCIEILLIVFPNYLQASTALHKKISAWYSHTSRLFWFPRLPFRVSAWLRHFDKI